LICFPFPFFQMINTAHLIMSPLSFLFQDFRLQSYTLYALLFSAGLFPEPQGAKTRKRRP
jgi:hypothetical protein